jgi:galactosamine-6-phosphate isomerase
MRTRLNSTAGKIAIQVAADHESMSRQAADIILSALRSKPDLLLCASAGGTPTRTYQLLAAAYRKYPKLFGGLRVLQIDEWGGLPVGSPATCEANLRRNLVEPLELPPERFIGLVSNSQHPFAESQRMAEWLAANGPIDLCILGLGVNGHIAMNEPGPALVPDAHVARLAKTSLKHSMLKKLKRKPKYGLTLGMADILRSRKILLLVSGTRKRAALARMLQPRITTRFPASFLWLHPDAVVLCDAQV